MSPLNHVILSNNHNLKLFHFSKRHCFSQKTPIKPRHVISALFLLAHQPLAQYTFAYKLMFFLPEMKKAKTSQIVKY